MRCPKCGYISFDHVENCLKCKKYISGIVEVQGTTYHVEAPSFLKIPGMDEPEDDDAGDLDGSFGLDLEEDEEPFATKLHVPDELSDISDLAPPAPEAVSLTPVSVHEEMTLLLDDDLDLDGLDLNLALGDDKETEPTLSLDDIHLSDDLVEISEDDDFSGLTVDLDLDSLNVGSKSPNKEKETLSESLDDISLSLD